MSDLYQPRSRIARVLGPKEAKAVRGLQKQIRKKRGQRLGKPMSIADAIDQVILDIQILRPKDLETIARETGWH